ncbi:MAG: carbon-nitrogen hydrolase family protein [Oscillospiraceae bacterium]|nr:carbon-nitrogen hydrolase family protein [Oscillospiraceae bacterium]
MKLRISLLQIAPTGSLQGNMQKGISACREAKVQGADIALFPEMYSIGYDIYDKPYEEWTAQSIAADDDFVQTFGRLAEELDMAIGITFLEKYEPKPRNSLVLFDRHGRRVLEYSKVHTCDFSAEDALCPGDGFVTCDLDTAQGNVRTGAMICFDREFPESTRILMLKGAEIVLQPNACPLEINRLSALRTRAYENMLAVATCNYPAGVPDCNGHSVVFDGVAWKRDEPGVRDMCILEADGAEGVYTAEVDMDMLREYRSHEVMGNCYRKVCAYSDLLSDRIDEPFIR